MAKQKQPAFKDEPIVQIKNTVLIPIAKLKPHPKNPNSHSKEQIKRLAEIIKYQGWRYPVKVSNQSGFVTSGHGRIEAAKLKGWTHVPVSYQDYKSKAQEYADVVSDNAIAEWAELDIDSIKAEVPKLGKDFDFDLLGVESIVLETMEEFGLDEKEVKHNETTHFLEVELSSEKEMIKLYENLLSRGFIVRYK